MQDSAVRIPSRTAGQWLSCIALLGGLLLLAPACERTANCPKVLIVGIDGADWDMIRPMLGRGELPHLTSLIQSGAHGPLHSLQPITSPVIWTTIATGKGPDQHGILDFTMPDPQSGEPVAISSNTRKSKAFWNILSEAGISCAVIGWWASWPAEPINGVMVSDRLSHHAFIKNVATQEGIVYPPEQTAEILALRREPLAVPYETAREFMAISPAEYAAAPELDFRDPISHFRLIYQTMTTYAEVAKHLIVTDCPEVLAVYFEGVDTAGHMYMRYTPPTYPHTTEAEREKFGQTVAAFYRYQDQLLGELLALTDEQTTVIIVSDHGFKTGRQRPVERASEVDYATAAMWHRMEGVIVMNGPAVLSQAAGVPAVTGKASVFDITPTLLALLGIPSASDMDGRVLNEMLIPGFVEPSRVATYEDDAWRENRAEVRLQTAGLDPETKARLRSLGYLGASESSQTLSLRGQWSLAEYYIFRQDYAKAEAELKDLAERAPDWAEPAYHLGLIYMRRQEYERARRAYEQALELNPEHLETRMNLAFIYRELRMRKKAIAVLMEAAEQRPNHPGVRVNLAMLHKDGGELEQALEFLREALRLNPDYHAAHVQSAMVYEMMHNSEQALEHWRAALRVRPNDSNARARLDRLEKVLAGE